MIVLIKLQILRFVYVEGTNFVVTGPWLQIEAVPVESGHKLRTAACGLRLLKPAVKVVDSPYAELCMYPARGPALPK